MSESSNFGIEDHSGRPALDQEDAKLLLEAAKTLLEDIGNGREWGQDEDATRENAEELAEAAENLKEELVDGGVTREFVVSHERPAVSYGPTRPTHTNEWVLAVTTEEAGRLEIALDEKAMYDLWIEVRGVPWPERAGEKHDRLVRQVVHAANGADEEMLWDALDALGVRP